MPHKPQQSQPARKTSAPGAPKRTRAQAARENGAKSRGPATPEGKARAAQNALKHGFRAAASNLLITQSEEFRQFRETWFEEHQPHGVTECELFDLWVFAFFQLRRISYLESVEQLENDLGSLGTLLNLARYRSSLERTRERAFKQFKELQNERYRREAPYRKPTHQLPPLVNANALRRQRMEYNFDHHIEPHQPSVWPYREFAKTPPEDADPDLCISSVDYPPSKIFELQSPFPQPPIHVLEKLWKKEQEEEAERTQSNPKAA